MYLETLDRRSSRPAAIRAKVSLHEKAARKDSAVHVSLSSDSLVKEPGERCPPTYINRRLNLPPPIDFGCTFHRNIVEEASEARHRTEAAAHRDPAYMPPRHPLSTRFRTEKLVPGKTGRPA